MSMGLWACTIVALIVTLLWIAAWVRDRREGARDHARGIKRKAHYRAWDLVFGRRRNLRLADHRNGAKEPRP